MTWRDVMWCDARDATPWQSISSSYVRNNMSLDVFAKIWGRWKEKKFKSKRTLSVHRMMSKKIAWYISVRTEEGGEKRLSLFLLSHRKPGMIVQNVSIHTRRWGQEGRERARRKVSEPDVREGLSRVGFRIW